MTLRLGLLLLLVSAGCKPGALYPDMAAPLDLGAANNGLVSDSSDAGLPGRTLLWHDEFEGAAGAAPDATYWSYDTGGTGWGNQELEFYTSRPSNVALDGEGHLAIVARAESYMGKAYTSGRINTLQHYTHAFGRFEARMQVPAGQGLWPAFWMLGNDYAASGWPACGEIDIVETKGQEPNIVHGTIHGPGYSGGSAITSKRDVPGPPLSDGFHVYAVEWTSEQIEFYVDDFKYATLTPASLPAGTSWVYDHPFGILLNVAVGGNFVGAPDATTTFPQTLLVDYVRVYAPAD